jgi:cobalt-zinc-cadmium efflux system outer membrane protein
MRLPNIVFAASLLLFSPGVSAQPPLAAAPEETFTLAAALAAMRAGHPALAAAGADVRASEGDAVDARLWTNPVVSTSWTPGIQNNSYDPSGYFSFGVSQFLELSGAPGARGRSAQSLVRAARATLDDVARGLALDLEAAMIHLAATQRRLAVSTRTRAMLGEVQRVVDSRVASGAAPRYDTTRIRTAVALAQADLDSAQADVYRARGEFAAAVGPGVGRLRGEASYPLDEPYPMVDLATLEDRLAARPDVRAATLRAAAADAAISVARRSVFPGVALQLAVGYGASPGQVDLGVGLTVPLPFVDRGQGSIPAAVARAASSRAFAGGLLALETPRLRGVFAEAQQRRAALAGFREVAPASSTEALTEAQAGYTNGRFSVLELADAYGSWRDAQQREIDLLEAVRQAELAVARVAGLQR